MFIGLQVNNWNKARSDRAREASIIEALKQEFRKLDGWVSSNIESHERGIDGLPVIADAINAGALPQDKRRRLNRDHNSGFSNELFNRIGRKQSGRNSHLFDLSGRSREKRPFTTSGKFQEYPKDSKRQVLAVSYRPGGVGAKIYTNA